MDKIVNPDRSVSRLSTRPPGTLDWSDLAQPESSLIVKFMRSQSEIYATKERTGNAIALVLVFIASLIIFLLFAAVPKEMAVGIPPDLHCQVYALARRGWGCSAIGDFSSNPLLCLAALFVSALCAGWYSRHPQVGMPWPYILVLQVAIVVFIACLPRFVYFFQGKVNSEHAIISAITTACAFGCIALCCFYLIHLKKRQMGE